MNWSERQYDIVGVGLGPANLGIAVAVDERNEVTGRQLSAKFFDRRSCFDWHPDMLLPSSVMQVSYLKDLATQRNPNSRFTFVSYLHEKGRLNDFINMQTFFPTRLEFIDYMRWTVDNLKTDLEWNTEVDQVDLVDGGCEVHSRRVGEKSVSRARNVVLGVGPTPVIPEWANGRNGRRVIHNSELLTGLSRVQLPPGGRIAVVGQGQSAAEVLRHLLESRPDLQAHCFISGYGMVPADNSPFANRVFDPSAVSEFYHAPQELRAELLTRHRTTNYGCVDRDLLDWLYTAEYTDKVRNDQRLVFRRASEVHNAVERPDSVALEFTERLVGSRTEERFDLVICATGFRSEIPLHLLGPAFGRDRKITLSRNYRVEVDGIPTPVFVVGSTDSNHGLSSALLSNIAVRSGEVLSEMQRTVDSEMAELFSELIRQDKLDAIC
ncbi:MULTISPECIES: lysine N(6)-hydroxylase/L-ornithine N(5)-oxygenase family protein [Rhodococcus]|uniref:lysine N(6)-hydroxylase/L-ornithine N(5)-oxygenase family protein n=1 Tax=Rhodococcus TaxID=1827 RepID=UPI001C560EEA|nr:SidA/IucD/PvdA family monooxygenase [Rhodococcus sp. LW-XY12]QXU55586.1 lysine N(6)-hydroxylase/L-ornithine N(5)-oxygenase family protein [Rhodococcus sp. LW-XY12]